VLRRDLFCGWAGLKDGKDVEMEQGRVIFQGRLRIFQRTDDGRFLID
jgi:hypothetical protein